MPVNFNAQFIVNEKTSTRVLRLTDTSTDFVLAKGNFSVTFPDGSQVLHTDFTSPDITAPGGSINIALITDIDNTILTGTYVIDFVALNAANTQFIKEETFDFNWEKPTKIILNQSDVVLPDIRFVDSTPYEQSGNFTGVLTRNFFTTTPSTSEVGVITKTSVGDVLMPAHSLKYYDGIYLVKSDISVAYTHSSKSWLTVSYVDLLQETYDIREAPTQDELVALMNTYKDQIEEYKTTNPNEYALRNEEYDLVVGLYSHLIARFQTGTLDGCKPILDQLLGLLPPQNPYTYKATQMLPFTINFTTSLTGTGTVGTIAKFTAGAAIGDSIIKEDAGKIGINKVPATTLDVNGAIQGTSIIKAGGTSSQFLKADGSVDSSAYLTGITSGQVTTALGYTPYNATNPNAYIALTALSAGAGISYSNTTGVIASTITQYTDALARASISLTTTGTSGSATYNSTTGVLNIPSYIGGVTSFNTRTGAITLTSLDVTTALTFTPYNATNPSAFISLTDLSAGTGISYNSGTGVITNTITQYTDALARASVSLTTTGTSGAATYDNTTGVLNIPQYQSVLTNPVTGSGVAGQVTFWDGTNSVTGDSGFVWDNTNKRLGIGVSTPTQLLHVGGNALFANPSNGFTTISLSNTNNTIGNNSGILQLFSSTNLIRIRQDSNNPVRVALLGASSYFSVADGNATDTFIVRKNGNVQINTTTDAGFRLDVNGTARVQDELTVNGINIGRGGGAIATNTRVGAGAGSVNTTGSNNSFFGGSAGASNTTGIDNTFVGRQAGQLNIAGNQNSFFGTNAGRQTTGSSNSFFGRQSGQSNTTGSSNSFFGVSSGTLNTASFNSFFGFLSGSSNTTGTDNSFFGSSSGENNTTGSNNSFVGENSGFANTIGSNNIAFGNNAGRYAGSGTTAMTSVDNSIYLGYQTRGLNATGSTNEIVIGYNVVGLGSNTTVIGNSSTTFGRWFGSLLIGTSTNVASSALTVDSTTQGFLPPRMTAAQRAAIATPAEGLIVVQTDGTQGMYIYINATWRTLAMV
jgi:hypothetical protein